MVLRGLRKETISTGQHMAELETVLINLMVTRLLTMVIHQDLQVS